MKVSFRLNGKSVKPEVLPGLTLLEFLRANGIFSVKHGCDHGECGACAVLMNGKTQNACLILMHTVDGKEVETLEGLSLQQRFLEEGAIQCGYCTPGMILSAEALLRENRNPTEDEIRDALAGNLCRCTGYIKPVEAVKR